MKYGLQKRAVRKAYLYLVNLPSYRCIDNLNYLLHWSNIACPDDGLTLARWAEPLLTAEERPLVYGRWSKDPS